MSKGKEVVDYKARMAARVQEVQEEEQPAVIQLSLAGGQMSLMEQALPNNQLECIILAVGTERSWYNRPFSLTIVPPPNCYAQKLGNDDTFRPTMVPAENVPEPPSDACSTCPNAKMGSAKQGKGPACKTRRRLVLAPATVADKPELLGKQLVIVNVPPTSGGNFSKYLAKLGANGFPPEGVVTRIGYVPSKRTLHEMTFEEVAPITNEGALAAIFGTELTAEYGSLITGGYSYEEEQADSGKF